MNLVFTILYKKTNVGILVLLLNTRTLINIYTLNLKVKATLNRDFTVKCRMIQS